MITAAYNILAKQNVPWDTGFIITDLISSITENLSRQPFQSTKMWNCSITPIFKCPTLESEELTTKKRLEIEQYFISLLKPYQPFCLNISKGKYPDSQQSNLLFPIQA